MTISNEPNNLEFLPNRLTITAKQQQAIQALGDKLKKETPAELIFVADRNGQVIASSGEFNREKLGELGALLAGDLAANEEIAKIIGSKQENQLILRENEGEHSFISEAGEFLILFVLTSSQVPLGWARLLIQQVSKELARTVEPSSNGHNPVELDLGTEGIGQDLSDNIDNLFS